METTTTNARESACLVMQNLASVVRKLPAALAGVLLFNGPGRSINSIAAENWTGIKEVHRLPKCDISDLGAVKLLHSESLVNCQEKSRLATDYEASTAEFSDAVTELRKKMGTSAHEEYQRLDCAANEARVKSEQARLSLEKHMATNRC